MEHALAYEKIGALRENLEKVIRGKRGAVDLSITALLARGHLLIEDVPGVGKTTLAHGLAKSINSTFQRIQFTSDLLPSDCIGVTVYNQADGSFQFKKGPVFSNIVLADEINRATPKTQSALLEAMNDRQVSVDGATYPLPEPFMLLATQNPVEFFGTFPLPESQLDRFTMCLKIGYPEESFEKEIIRTSSGKTLRDLAPVLSREDVLFLQGLAEGVRVDEDLVDYIISIARATREHRDIRLGVSPRGTMTLLQAARAFALTQGRSYCIPDDIKRLAPDVLSHRMILDASSGAGKETARDLVQEIVSSVRVPV